MWKVLGSSVAGSSHIRVSKPCDDANHFAQWKDGTLVAAVADGAGSAKASRQGAQFSSEQVIRIVRRIENLDLIKGKDQTDHMARSIVTSVITSLRAFASDWGRPVDDFACTLILAVLNARGGFIVQIGDGAAVALYDDATLVALTRPDHGQYLNETVFLTSSDALSRCQVSVCERPVASVALFTDGLERLALNIESGAPHAPFFTPLFQFVGSSQADKRQLDAFLESERIVAATDDDKTLLLASR